MKRAKLASVVILVLLCIGLAACDFGEKEFDTDNNLSDNITENGAEGLPEQGEPEEGGPDSSVGDGTAPSDILVVYFSATGNTKPIAEYAAEYLNADIYEIVPETPYTADDLKYYTDCRADREQRDPTARPAIAGRVGDMSKYDIVLIGYPIWHGQAPKIIYTFLESYNFDGKEIVPFCTSGSSGVGSSVTSLKTAAPYAKWQSGTRFAIGADKTEVRNWVDGLGILRDNVKEITAMYIYCLDRRLEVELADNASAKAFVERLKSGDVTVEMEDYGDFEKVGSLGFSVVQSNARITTAPGDVILYQGNSVTVYYDRNSYSFTLLGRIKGMTRESMLEFFGGKGAVTVRFSLK